MIGMPETSPESLNPPTTTDISDEVDTSTTEAVEAVVDETVAAADDAAEAIEDEFEEAGATLSRSVLVLREVIGRQVVAGQGLTTELVELATEVGQVLVHAPAVVVEAIRGGATLPAALSQSRSEISETVLNAGDRLRTVVGGYVERQAVLPNAVISGASGVASTVVKAQGLVGGSAVNAVFTVAAAATNRGDVRQVWESELRQVNEKADVARDDIKVSVDAARREISDAVAVGEAAVHEVSVEEAADEVPAGA